MTAHRAAAPPRIVLIHAVQAAVAPIEHALDRLWPEAVRSNLIDAALPADLERAGGLTPELHQRIRRLVDQAIAQRADGVLFTCSAFGDAIAAAAAAVPLPVLKPNEAMFAQALTQGRRIGMVATFAASVPSMEAEFHEMARRLGSGATLETVCVPEAIAAARQGDIATHDRLVVAAAPALAHCDLLMLAHYSTSTALAAVQRVMAIPVLGAPEAAVQALRERLGLPPSTPG